MHYQPQSFCELRFQTADGLKLCDLCDIVIDNCGEPGDACLEISGVRCGPTSTVMGAALLQEIVCRVVALLQERAPERQANGRRYF